MKNGGYRKMINQIGHPLSMPEALSPTPKPTRFAPMTKFFAPETKQLGAPRTVTQTRHLCARPSLAFSHLITIYRSGRSSLPRFFLPYFKKKYGHQSSRYYARRCPIIRQKQRPNEAIHHVIQSGTLSCNQFVTNYEFGIVISRPTGVRDFSINDQSASFLTLYSSLTYPSIDSTSVISSMVAISPPAKVLVTGANGYLATWVVKKYLEAGYSVRGAVRSLTKGAFLNDKFAQYGNKFELVVVDDITKDGAFDEAVKGVDAIAHTASPFNYNASNPDGMFNCSSVPILSVVNDETFRSHRPCPTGDHNSPELRLETWERPEACDSHVLGRRSSRSDLGTARLHGKLLERSCSGGGEGKDLCSGAFDLFCLEDIGREGRVGVRRRS